MCVYKIEKYDQICRSLKKLKLFLYINSSYIKNKFDEAIISNNTKNTIIFYLKLSIISFYHL